jgi:exosortase/archaeosortase family protein
LALPIVASAQFYLGYPLRTMTAECSASMLRFSGFMVVRKGTALDWGGTLVLVDAPCSGVRMLWMGLYLALTLSCAFGLSARKTLVAAGCATVAVLAGNVLRASALFFTETGVVDAPAWMHDGAGVVAFAAVACVIVAMVRAIERGRLWQEPLST